VTLFFHGKLYRGNRALKVDARRFGAFDSPNCPSLATVEAGIEGIIKIGLKLVEVLEITLSRFLSWIPLIQFPGSLRLDRLLHCSLDRGDTSLVLNLSALSIKRAHFTFLSFCS